MANPDTKIQIIAEIAQGFEGYPMQASLLVRAAAKAGADAAKLQMVFADELATPDYQHYDLFKSLEMSEEEWRDLAETARRNGIALQTDIFGRQSLALASAIGVETIKLHGTDIANPGLLQDVAQSSVSSIMLGAGGAYISEIEAALDILSDKDIILLLGFQAYPTPTDTNQISRVSFLADRYRSYPNVVLGFADHASPENLQRISLASAALGAGAQVIEKHLTLGRNMELEDFESALNPDEFGQFCDTIRATASALGSTAATDDLGMSGAEAGYRQNIRRHVAAAHDLQAGQTLTAADLVLKRTANTMAMTSLTGMIGKRLKCDVIANQALQSDFLEEG